MPEGSSLFCLIGRKVTGGVALSGPSLVPQDLSFENHSWSVSGDKFSRYDVSADQTSGHRTEVLAAEWQASSPRWVWNQGAEATVTCTFDIVYNETILATLNLVKQVTVEEPTSIFLAEAAHQNYRLNFYIASGGNSTVLSDEGNQVGINYFGNVHKSSRYSSYGTGQFAWVQLCQLNRNRGFLSPIITNGLVLDNEFPYAPGGSDDELTMNKNFDTPADVFSNTCTISDSFKMYIMSSAGAGAEHHKWEYVPTRILFWNWLAEADSLFGDHGAGTSNLGIIQTTQHPTWTEKFSNP